MPNALYLQPIYLQIHLLHESGPAIFRTNTKVIIRNRIHKIHCCFSSCLVLIFHRQNLVACSGIQVDKLPLKPGWFKVFSQFFNVNGSTTLNIKTLFVPFEQIPLVKFTPLIPAVQSEPAADAVGNTPFLDSRKLLIVANFHCLALSR